MPDLGPIEFLLIWAIGFGLFVWFVYSIARAAVRREIRDHEVREHDRSRSSDDPG